MMPGLEEHDAHRGRESEEDDGHFNHELTSWDIREQDGERNSNHSKNNIVVDLRKR